MACAFFERACRRGYKAAYLRLPRLLQLAVARGDGTYARILERLARFELPAIDDWLLAPLRDPERRDLVEVIEDRSDRASTLIASQLSTDDWHAGIGDPNLADSICDREIRGWPAPCPAHECGRGTARGRALRRALQRCAVAQRDRLAM